MYPRHPTYHLQLTQRPLRRRAGVFVGRVSVDVSARFMGLADGTYRLRAYVLTGADTCWASLSGQTSLTATLRCNQPPLNIRIKSVDALTAETDLIPRVGSGLGSLNLSVEELDGQNLAGFTYRWSEPTSTSAVATTATSTTLTGRRIGNYKVTLVSGTDTLVAYTTLRAKPCRTLAQTYNCGTAPSPTRAGQLSPAWPPRRHHPHGRLQPDRNGGAAGVAHDGQ